MLLLLYSLRLLPIGYLWDRYTFVVVPVDWYACRGRSISYTVAQVSLGAKRR